MLEEYFMFKYIIVLLAVPGLFKFTFVHKKPPSGTT